MHWSGALLLGGALSGSADIVAQRIASPDKPIQFKTALFQAVVAAGYRIPALQLWLRIVDKYSLFQKVLLDQLVFSPVLIAGYLAIVALAKGKTLKEFLGDMKGNYFKILLNNYKLWPLVSWINYKFVPLKFRVFVSMFVGFFWTIYLILSTTHSKNKASE